MDVTSVISQYQIAGQINLAASINSTPWSNSETLGRWAIRGPPDHLVHSHPGRQICAQPDGPHPPAAILSLLQAGYPADLVFRMLVQEINGIRNRFGGKPGLDPPTRVLPAPREIAEDSILRAVGMRVQRKDKEEAALMVFRGKRIRRWSH